MLRQSLVGELACVRGTFERLNVGDSSEINRASDAADARC
jgi:hypothetical protein